MYGTVIDVFWFRFKFFKYGLRSPIYPYVTDPHKDFDYGVLGRALGQITPVSTLAKNKNSRDFSYKLPMLAGLSNKQKPEG